MQMADKKLERVAAPENLGISSEAFIEMARRIEETMLFHSLMIVRNGKVAAECYRYPYNEASPHTMYSVSKTITATAVGFAVSEGIISLDTRLLDLFPEYTPKKKDDNLDKLCVRHLVTLTAGRLTNPLLTKTAEDWLAQLTGGKCVGEPGERFDYINEDMYALCAVVSRATGGSVVDFLYPRLFEPLGIEKPFWETDHRGIEAGGWGIFLKTEDLSKIMYCYMHGGKWGDRQVIPQPWATQAISPQGVYKGKPIDGDCYGYGIWVVSDNEFRARGMFDQLSTALIDRDTVITVTSCDNDERPYWDAVAAFKDKLFTDVNPDAVKTSEYTEYVDSLAVDVIPKTELHSPLEKEIAGRTIHFRKNILINLIGFPTSVLNTAAVYMSRDHAGNIDNVRFDFDKDGGSFYWEENDEKNTVRFGMDGVYRYTPITLARTPYTAACAAFWRNEKTLEVWIRPLESLAKRSMKFTFNNKKVVMEPSSDPTMQSFVDCIAGTVEGMFKQKALKKLAGFGLRKFRELLEHKHYGRFVK